MKNSFLLVVCLGAAIGLFEASTDSGRFVTPPFGFFMFLAGPYLILLLTAFMDAPETGYKGRFAVSLVALALSVLAQGYLFTTGPDYSGVGISALPAALMVLVQYLVAVIYLIVHGVKYFKLRKVM